MGRSLKSLRDNESGSILILCVFTFIIVIILTGFVIDLGLMYCMRIRLLEVGHLAREARFNETSYLNDSENPNRAFREIIERCVVENGIPREQLRTEFKETLREHNRREYKVDIYLCDTYKFTFLKIFGITDYTVNIHIPGSGYVSMPGDIGVWYPGR